MDSRLEKERKKDILTARGRRDGFSVSGKKKKKTDRQKENTLLLPSFFPSFLPFFCSKLGLAENVSFCNEEACKRLYIDRSYILSSLLGDHSHQTGRFHTVGRPIGSNFPSIRHHTTLSFAMVHTLSCLYELT